MLNSKKLLPVLIVFSIAVSLVCGSLYAGEKKLSAPEILANMDKTIAGFDDQYIEVTMTIVDATGKEKSYDFNVFQKGDTKRLVRFTTGDFKGMAMLIQDRNRMFIYLPGMKRVRRVAAHNMNQTFAGSDLTNEDMATAGFSKEWSVTLESEDAEAWYLKGKPKKGVKTIYSYLTFKVGKKHFSQLRTEYFNEKGEMVKIWENSDWGALGNSPERHRKVEVTDPRTGHKTRMDVHKFEVNKGVKDNVFTVRRLQWGR